MIRAALPVANTSDAPFALPPDVVLDLPVPPSVNRVRKIDWKNGKLVKKWVDRADRHVLFAKARNVNPLKLTQHKRFELHVVMSEHLSKLDLDNVLKVLIDYLRRIQLVQNDGPEHMRKLVVEWGIAPEGCRVTVRPLGPARVGAYGVGR